jgi:hypothetical protein
MALAAVWVELESLRARAAQLEAAKIGTDDEPRRVLRADCQALRAAVVFIASAAAVPAEPAEPEPEPEQQQEPGAGLDAATKQPEDVWKPEELVLQQEMLTHLLVEGQHAAGRAEIERKLRVVKQQLDRACVQSS